MGGTVNAVVMSVLLRDGRYSQYSSDKCLSCCVMGGTVNAAVMSVCLVV